MHIVKNDKDSKDNTKNSIKTIDIIFGVLILTLLLVIFLSVIATIEP